MVPSEISNTFPVVFSQQYALAGSVQVFYGDKGYGFINGPGGRVYFFHATEHRLIQEQGEDFLFRRVQESPIPKKGDRVLFVAVPARRGTAYAQAIPWGFDPRPRAATVAPRTSLPMAPAATAAPASQLEPIQALILRKSMGNAGVATALVALERTQTEWAMRMFLEVCLEGEALGLDYQRRSAEHPAGSYSWAKYLEATVEANFHKILGPKACLLSSDVKARIWMEALLLRRRLTEAEVMDIYYAAPAAMTRYSSVCRGCPERQCQFYKSEASVASGAG